jgi:hypothetical protein
VFHQLRRAATWITRQLLPRDGTPPSTRPRTRPVESVDEPRIRCGLRSQRPPAESVPADDHPLVHPYVLRPDEWARSRMDARPRTGDPQPMSAPEWAWSISTTVGYTGTDYLPGWADDDPSLTGVPLDLLTGAMGGRQPPGSLRGPVDAGSLPGVRGGAQSGGGGGGLLGLHRLLPTSKTPSRAFRSSTSASSRTTGSTTSTRTDSPRWPANYAPKPTASTTRYARGSSPSAPTWPLTTSPERPHPPAVAPCLSAAAEGCLVFRVRTYGNVSASIREKMRSLSPLTGPRQRTGTADAPRNAEGYVAAAYSLARR